jgi:NitT/TauT family transport system substrate-binding protein
MEPARRRSAWRGLARLWALILAVTALAYATGCGDAGGDGSPEVPRVRLGYFANVTHATAIVGIERELFREALGERARLEPYTFNAGPAAVEALLSGSLDATYIGPNPAINAYVKSRGTAVRVISGATSGGAFLVVDPSIASARDLRGKTLATPQLGNTQDVALRSWLREQGYIVELTSGDVRIVPQENAATLESFRERRIAGAWVPEPWATRLQLEGGGKVLVDERDLWPGGKFVTTHLVVATAFLERHPELVEALLRAHLEAERIVLDDPDGARETVNASIARITGKRIADATLEGAWRSLTFTHDPLADTLVESARDADELELVDLGGIDVRGIYELGPLNRVLREGGRAGIAPEAGK